MKFSQKDNETLLKNEIRIWERLVNKQRKEINKYRDALMDIMACMSEKEKDCDAVLKTIFKIAYKAYCER